MRMAGVSSFLSCQAGTLVPRLQDLQVALGLVSTQPIPRATGKQFKSGGVGYIFAARSLSFQERGNVAQRSGRMLLPVYTRMSDIGEL